MTEMILPAAAAGTPHKTADAGLEPAPVSPDFIERVMLLASELVTNGVGHGNRPAGAPVELSLGVEPHGIRLKMHDPEPGFEARRPGSAPDPAGRDTLAGAEGRTQPCGSVWFETVRSRPECQGSRPNEEQTARKDS